MKKNLKFTSDLVPLILSGEKYSTWRLFDDKELKVGDELSLMNIEDGVEFAQALVSKVAEKKMGEVVEDDFQGHRRYASEEEMHKEFRVYYRDQVNEDKYVKIIHFKLVV